MVMSRERPATPCSRAVRRLRLPTECVGEGHGFLRREPRELDLARWNPRLDTGSLDDPAVHDDGDLRLTRRIAAARPVISSSLFAASGYRTRSTTQLDSSTW